eukprot:363412-Chlamydomonas_euryale.AAC.8
MQQTHGVHTRILQLPPVFQHAGILKVCMPRSGSCPYLPACGHTHGVHARAWQLPPVFQNGERRLRQVNGRRRIAGVGPRDAQHHLAVWRRAGPGGVWAAARRGWSVGVMMVSGKGGEGV